MKLTRKQWGYVVALFILFVILNSDFFWKLMYPIQFQDEVKEASEYFETDPFLILAIVQTESNFKSDRLSRKGATGLMQLMPDTAYWANEKSGLNKDPDSFRNDPRSNILLGTWYLSYLVNKYNGDKVMTIAAYNAGQGHVDRWLNEEIWDGSEHRLDQIPFGETRHYVSRVLYYYKRYQGIYERDFIVNENNE